MRLELTGLEELKAALHQLPEELHDEAFGIVADTTDKAEVALLEAYPSRSGKMKKGVSKKVERSQFGIVGTVTSKSDEAVWWEFGTVNRRTKQGWNRGRGPAHSKEGLAAIASRMRRRMNERLIEVVRKAGFVVSGSLE